MTNKGQQTLARIAPQLLFRDFPSPIPTSSIKRRCKTCFQNAETPTENCIWNSLISTIPPRFQITCMNLFHNLWPIKIQKHTNMQTQQQLAQNPHRSLNFNSAIRETKSRSLSENEKKQNHSSTLQFLSWERKQREKEKPAKASAKQKKEFNSESTTRKEVIQLIYP